MRALVVEPCKPGLRDDRDGREEQDHHSLPDDRENRKLDFP